MTAPESKPLHFTHDLELHDEARALIDFDIDSIRQMVSAQRDSEPSVWVVAPEGYEKDGHALRDNETIRLIAYAAESGMVYATDGCNSCRHTPGVRIETATPRELESLSTQAQLPPAMLRVLAGLLSGTEPL